MEVVDNLEYEWGESSASTYSLSEENNIWDQGHRQLPKLSFIKSETKDDDFELVFSSTSPVSLSEENASWASQSHISSSGDRDENLPSPPKDPPNWTTAPVPKKRTSQGRLRDSANKSRKLNSRGIRDSFAIHSNPCICTKKGRNDCKNVLSEIVYNLGYEILDYVTRERTKHLKKSPEERRNE